ncbi:hypothetical protein [Spiroplasma endosymbiont of Cantharis lateralis]|uniref:hypothetical protein n=1 Tax=Spiroplasma endosymbiont of Cantharis lateralis TaxID=3066277 RepID=UPI00313BD463
MKKILTFLSAVLLISSTPVLSVSCSTGPITFKSKLSSAIKDMNIKVDQNTEINEEFILNYIFTSRGLDTEELQKGISVSKVKPTDEQKTKYEAKITVTSESIRYEEETFTSNIILFFE